MPLRPRQRARLHLQPQAQRPLRRRLPDADLRPADRPHRPAYRGAGGDCRRLLLPPPAEGSREVAERVAQARERQAARYAAIGRSNAAVSGTVLEDVARPDSSGLALLREAADAMRLSARGYHRVLRVARTLADLDGADKVGRVHLAEALSYRALTDEVRRAA